MAAATETGASASPGPAEPAWAQPLEGALRAAAVHSAALVLNSAAQHLQRTTLLVEAATARALARAGGDVDADQGLAVARAALVEAMRLFQAAQDQASRILSGGS